MKRFFIFLAVVSAAVFFGCETVEQATVDVIQTDEGQQETETTVPNCDDGNKCTVDSYDASAGKCVHEPVVCEDDGDPCAASLCLAGKGCFQVFGTVETEGKECNDGNACTSDDKCKWKTCSGAAVDCNDHNPCTDDSCNSADGCVYATNAETCDDGDKFTIGEKCKNGECVGGEKVQCLTTEDCAKYEDGDFCNGFLFCHEGLCKVKLNTVADCSKYDEPCLTHKCQPSTGKCLSVFLSGAPCNDGDLCTVGDTCDNGICKGAVKDCNDGNLCTDDFCKSLAGGGCEHVFNALNCSDGNPFTVNDACFLGVCSGEPVEVECDSDADCEDGDVKCTNDFCDNGECASKPTDCDDGIPCTVDSCQPSTGCQNKPDNSLCGGETPFCSSGTDYTVADGCLECSLEYYMGEDPCNDDKICTIDYCNPQNGKCDHQQVEEGGWCYINYPYYKPGKCLYGACQFYCTNDWDCDDKDPCTKDKCQDGGGCLHIDLTPYYCDDGDPCTKDTCGEDWPWGGWTCAWEPIPDCNDE